MWVRGGAFYLLYLCCISKHNKNNNNTPPGTASIGAGIDSYYEYMLKSCVLLGDYDYCRMFNLVISCCNNTNNTPSELPGYQKAPEI
jgi:hypothetical protein